MRWPGGRLFFCAFSSTKQRRLVRFVCLLNLDGGLAHWEVLLFTNVRSKACHSYRHTLKSHPALLSASTSPRDRLRPILVLSSVAASTMSSEESPTSARARSMALARALLERTHSRSDGIPRPTALGAASRISAGQSGCLEVCRAASHLVPACTPSPSGLACCRPACRALTRLK